MTVAQLVILPGILIAAFLAGLLLLALRITSAHLADARARRRQAEIVSAAWQHRYQVLADQEGRQAAVIAAVICELESRRATYETFPQDLRESLYSAHDSGRQLEKEIR